MACYCADHNGIRTFHSLCLETGGIHQQVEYATEQELPTKMSTKRQLREQAAAGKTYKSSRVTMFAYMGVCLLLLAGVILMLVAGGTLMKNMRGAKNVSTNLESYTPWPKEVRAEFQKIMIQNGGRIKPVNTYGRFSLLQLNNGTRITFATKDGKKHKIKADEWLLDSLFRPDIAKELPFFNVDDTDFLEGLGIQPKKGDSKLRKRDRYSYNHLLPARAQLANDVEKIREKQKLYEKDEDPNYKLTRTETQILRFSGNINFFEYLAGQFAVCRDSEIATALLESKISARELFSHIKQDPQTDREKALDSAARMFYFYANSAVTLTIVPPAEKLDDEWGGIGHALAAGIQDFTKRPWTIENLKALAELYSLQRTMFEGLAKLPKKAKKEERAAIIEPVAEGFANYVKRQKEETKARYEAKIKDLDQKILAAADEELEKERLNDKKRRTKLEGATSNREVKLYNRAYFHNSLAYFIMGFLILAASWLAPGSKVSKILVWIAVAVTVFALMFNVVGIFQRSIVRSRPPITNLYDTVIFITAVAVILSLALEYFTRRGVGLLLAVLSGVGGMFLSLRYEVKEATDTMDPLQAVLDTNFWLATHVTTINIGYAAGLLAMLLGAYYLLHRFLRPLKGILFGKHDPASGGSLFNEDKPARDFFKSITKMTYGVICFCLFFSIVGTVLGGVWANYSWGRFWGWDPKENGALMICLWALVILHAKMGGYLRDIGIAVNAIFLGMIVTFSWWGVNNLGIGLHSYGFTKGVWQALVITWIVCACIMACGIPLWMHERARKAGKMTGASKRREKEKDNLPDSGLADGGATA